MSLTSARQDAVREQLNRILASRQFRKSKRFPDFLRYTVEHTLSNNADDIKERSIGVEVFGRNANYDTSVDPVVRMTAAEVRKRIAQYYHETPGREFEVRIDFPRGSYVPEFSFPEMVSGGRLPPVVDAPQPQKSTRRWALAGALLAVCVLAAGFVWWRMPAREDALHLFWAPLESSSSPILLCIPDMNAVQPPSVNPPPTESFAGALTSLPTWFRRERVVYGDSLALATLTGLFGREQHPFYIRRTDDATLQDLRQGPVVLLGGRSNQWSVELGKELRYSFVRDGELRYISDSQNPGSRQWSVYGNMHDPGGNITEDYALVSRVVDPTTGHLLVTVAGILQYGTEAGAQCLVDEACLAHAEQLAPGDWKRKNIQMVIVTPIIGGDSGQPRVLSVYLW
jgi:hypothetical protein